MDNCPKCRKPLKWIPPPAGGAGKGKWVCDCGLVIDKK
jgi:hypothetical protein